MRAILINPIDQTICDVDHTGHFRDVYSLIDAEPFDCVAIDDDNVMFVDDEGLFRDGQRFFILDGYATPIGGKALIVGWRGPETVATTLDVDTVRARVTFRPDIIICDGMDPIPAGTMVDHPVLGRVPVFGSTPRFSRR